MTINRTLVEVEDLMKSLARLVLGIPETEHSAVRIAYGANSKTGSAPTHTPSDSILYVYVNPTDDGYGKQHHLTYMNGAEVDGDMTEVDEYTEEYAVTYSFYGYDAYDRARAMRDGVYGVAVKEFLWGTKVHPKMGIPELVQTHEVINTFWVKRCDLVVTFYAYVRIERESAIKDIEQVSVSFSSELNKSATHRPE